MVGAVAATQGDDALPRVVFPAPIAVSLDDRKLVFLNASHFPSTLNIESGHVPRAVWYAAMFDALRRKRARREPPRETPLRWLSGKRARREPPR